MMSANLEESFIRSNSTSSSVRERAAEVLIDKQIVDAGSSSDFRDVAVTVDRSITSSIKSSLKEDAVPFVIPKRDNLWCILVFTLCGNGTLFFWNSLLNCVFDVIGLQYSDPQYEGMSDYLTAVNNTLTVCVSIIVLAFGGSLHQWMLYVGYSLLVVCSILFAVIVQCFDGHTGYSLHLTLQVFGGIGAGLSESAIFAFACVLPKIYAGWVSFGMGVSGILSFMIYMLFSECVFDGNVQGDVWVNMGFSAALTLLALAGLVWLFRCEWAMKSITEVQEINRRKRGQELLPGEEIPMSYWEVFKHTWLAQLNVFLVMWVSLFVFPNAGPLAWGDNSTETNTVMGMFQVGDFLGRYIPNAAVWLPFVMFNKSWLYVLTYVRLVFIALFIVCMQWPVSNIWGNFGVHIVLMLALAITNGYYLTLSMIYIPSSLERQCDRNKSSALGVIFLLLGIACGLWMAKLFQLLPDPHLLMM